MGDLKVSEGFLDAVMIRKAADGTAATGLVPVCTVMKLSDGTTVTPAISELTLGVYKATNWIPAADTEYLTIWTVAGAYVIYVAYKLFKVGGGRIEDVYDLIKTGGSGGYFLDIDLDHLLKTAHPSGDPVADTIFDLIMNKDAGQTYNRATDSLELLGELLAALTADVGVFPTANYATLAAYVEDIRTRLIAIVADTGAIAWGDITGIVNDIGVFPTANYATLAAYVEDIRSRLVVIDGFHDVPVADVVTNAQMRDVIGNKTDTAAGGIAGTNSLMRYMKGLLGAGWTAESLKAVYDLADALMDSSETGGTVAADGNEQTVYEQAAPAAIWNPAVVYIDLTNMQAGDSITVIEHIKIANGGAYIKHDGVVYTGAQPTNQKLIAVSPVGRKNRWGYKVTLEQTAGVNRNYVWGVIYES